MSEPKEPYILASVKYSKYTNIAILEFRSEELLPGQILREVTEAVQKRPVFKTQKIVQWTFHLPVEPLMTRLLKKLVNIK
jgi:hypothetical protein